MGSIAFSTTAKEDLMKAERRAAWMAALNVLGGLGLIATAWLMMARYVLPYLGAQRHDTWPFSPTAWYISMAAVVVFTAISFQVVFERSRGMQAQFIKQLGPLPRAVAAGLGTLCLLSGVYAAAGIFIAYTIVSFAMKAGNSQRHAAKKERKRRQRIETDPDLRATVLRILEEAKGPTDGSTIRFWMPHLSGADSSAVIVRLTNEGAIRLDHRGYFLQQRGLDELNFWRHMQKRKTGRS